VELEGFNTDTVKLAATIKKNFEELEYKPSFLQIGRFLSHEVRQDAVQRCAWTLIAIELKLGKFKAVYKGQMELYLRWLEAEPAEGQNRIQMMSGGQNRGNHGTAYIILPFFRNRYDVPGIPLWATPMLRRFTYNLGQF